MYFYNEMGFEYANYEDLLKRLQHILLLKAMQQKITRQDFKSVDINKVLLRKLWGNL